MARARKVKGISCRGAIVDNARKVIDSRLDELLSFSQYVGDPANVTELHDLRIAAKRLRYSMELFRFAFPSEIGRLIDEVKEIQEHIGAMHDADVMIERVVEIVAADARSRTTRLIEIATAIDRGSVAQRQQRMRSALATKTAPRDELAFFTLIAHRANDRDASYDHFVEVWRRMEETEFPSRLRRCIGVEVAPDEAQPVTEQAAG